MHFSGTIPLRFIDKFVIAEKNDCYESLTQAKSVSDGQLWQGFEVGCTNMVDLIEYCQLFILFHVPF